MVHFLRVRNVMLTLTIQVIFLCIVSTIVGAKEMSATSSNSQKSIHIEIERNRDAIVEIRRDQLNYKVEKDLLKEAYSSNLQTVNLVITLILGVFTILGFLGLRSISGFRKEFKAEFEHLQDLRSQFERKLSDLEEEQQNAKTKLEEISTINAKQDTRLQILELQEKVESLINQKAYSRALYFLDVGLDLTPNDLVLLQQRAHSLSCLNLYSEAITAWEKVLNVEPDNRAAPCDLAELYLFISDFNKYETFSGKHQEVLDSKGPFFSWYLECLRLYMSSDLSALRQNISNKLPEIPENRVTLIDNWRFAEVRFLVGAKRDSPERIVFYKFLDLLEGKKSKKDLQEMVIAGSN